MRRAREEWTVECPGDMDYCRIGDLVTISNGTREVTAIVCEDHTSTCDECCVKKVFGLVTCRDVPVSCIGHHYELVEDML